MNAYSVEIGDNLALTLICVAIALAIGMAARRRK